MKLVRSNQHEYHVVHLGALIGQVFYSPVDKDWEVYLVDRLKPLRTCLYPNRKALEKALSTHLEGTL